MLCGFPIGVRAEPMFIAIVSSGAILDISSLRIRDSDKSIGMYIKSAVSFMITADVREATIINTTTNNFGLCIYLMMSLLESL